MRSRISHSGSFEVGIMQFQTLPSIRLTSSAVVPTSTISPAFIMALRVEIYSMSDTIWVEINTIRSCENSEMKFRRRTRSPGSSPAVGSSMTSISGSFNIACAIPTRRFMPPDRLEIFFFFTSESERMSNK